jgi:hypothetical protein
MMRGASRAFVVALALLVAAGASGAQSTSSELVPSPIAVSVGALGEPLPVDTLMEAALTFSGAPDEAMARERDALGRLVSGFQRSATGITDEGRLGEMALAYLHKNVLTSYRVLQTRVDTALDTGTFNCVSSAVLYLIMARSVGLEVSGVRTSDHAFCSVKVGGTPVDVETTNLYGFNPGTKKEFKDLFGKITGYSYVSPSSYSDRRAIGEKELLGLILSNRVSDLTERGAYREALSPAASAYALLGGPEFRQVFTIAVSNYTVWLGSRGDFARARGLLDSAENLSGPDKSLDARRRELFHNQAVALTEAGSLDEVRDLLGKSAEETPLDARDWTELSIFLVQRDAEAVARGGEFTAAARTVAAGMDRLGRLPELLSAYEAFTHNQFATLFNSRRYGEARSVLVAGLAVYAESRILSQDLGIVDKALRRQ